MFKYIPCNSLSAAALSSTTCKAVNKKNKPPNTSTKQVVNKAYCKLRNKTWGLGDGGTEIIDWFAYVLLYKGVEVEKATVPKLKIPLKNSDN